MQKSSAAASDLQAPPAPGAPAAPAAPVVVGATTGQGTTLAIPKTAQELDALRSQREEISNQLESATSRRSELARKLPSMDEAARPGIVNRIALLDRRILNLESQLDQTGQQLAAVSPAVLASTASPGAMFDRLDADAVTGITVTFTLFVLAPMAIAAARLMWKRAVAPAPRAPALGAETAQRLERIENAVDSIAIEVERVSEGQRFLTRLFTQSGKEPSPAALGVGEQRPAEPIPVGEGVGQGRMR